MIPEGQLPFMSLGFPGYSSSSSSTTSLEGKRNYSKKRNSTSSSKKTLTRVSSASSKISAGMVCCIEVCFHRGEFTAALSTYVELLVLFQNLRWFERDTSEVV